MASLPHTPTSSTPATSYSHLGPALVGTGRETGARFANRSATPPPSAVHHSFHPIRDIVSGSGSNDHSQRDSAPSKGRTLEETEYSPPGAFPSEEEEREPDAGEEVKHAVTAIRGYAQSHLPAALGIYVGYNMDEDQLPKNHAMSGESSALSPEDHEPSPEAHSRSTAATDSPHNTNPFRDPEFIRTHGSRASQQPDTHQGESPSDVSRMRMSSTESFPTSTRPSCYTDEPSAWSSPYADTAVPPTRTYDVVREPPTDKSQDVSSGFGESIGTASPLEPITTARAVPFMAEPPLVVYSNTSAAIFASGGDKIHPSESKPSEASIQDASTLATHTIFDEEQSANRDVGAEGKGFGELPRDSNAEAKERSKGLFSRLNTFFFGKSTGKREESSATDPSSPQGERDIGHLTTDETSSGRASVQSNPVDASVQPPSKKSGHGRVAHPKLTGFRRHTLPDIIPKNVPAHFDETIGPLPRHVELRGKGEFPTKEKPGGSRVGVGSLPGRRDEAGVARLPDERNGLIAAPQSRAYDEHDVGTSSTSQAPQRRSSSIQGNSSSASSSSEAAEEVHEPRNGFMSEFICEAEEILRDLGDVALYYVPGFDYLSDWDSKVDNPEESQPIDTTQVSVAQSSPSPSPVAAASPTRAPPSSPVIGMQTDPRQTSIEGENTGSEVSRSVATTSTTPPLVTDFRPFSARFSASAQSDQLGTPMDSSAHPSRSSSAEEVNNEVFIIGPPSTRERISGKQEHVASPLKREYVKPPTFEDHAAAGAAGSLPWYPTETGLKALIGERMHDDQMRAAGAAEPEERTTSLLTNPLEVPKEESTTTETPVENQFTPRDQTVPLHSALSPPPIVPTTFDNVETTVKGLDVKSLGAPVAEEKKRPSIIFSDQRRKSHN